MKTDDGDSRPTPDPTVLTTEQSDRLREEMIGKIDGLNDTIEQRLNLNETHRKELKEEKDKTLASTLAASKELADEKSKNYEKQIAAQGALLASYKENTDAKNDDLKDRVTKLESQGRAIFIMIGLLVGIATVAIAAVALFRPHS